MEREGEHALMQQSLYAKVVISYVRLCGKEEHSGVRKYGQKTSFYEDCC